MNGNIKFRAIHKLTKKKWYEEDLIFHNGEFYEDWRAFEDGIPLNMEQWAVMQYTGVNDVDGVEIYGGYILKIVEVSNHGMKEYVTDVKWEDACYALKSSDVDYYDTFLGAWAGDPNQTYPLFELKVIGNIYENPELLEEITK